MLTRICRLLSRSLTVTDVVESTVTAKGTPSSSVLAYRFPIDVPGEDKYKVELSVMYDTKMPDKYRTKQILWVTQLASLTARG